MFKKILLLVLAAIVIAGCADSSAQVNNSVPAKPEKEHVAKFDQEAASLGFPEKFISKEEERINWDEATTTKVDDMDVEVYDTGVTLEVCGGIGCDM